MQTRPAARTLILVIAVATLLAACGSGGSPSASPSDSTPSSRPAPSLAIPISTAEAAMAAVVAAEPRFVDVSPRDLDVIGQSKWWEAMPASGVGAFVVTISVGWGDCQAGCINEHHWMYAVTPDGGVRLLSEDGPAVPDGLLPA